MNAAPPSTDAAHHRRTAVRLGILFGGLYFIQGIVEPQSGVIYQPLLALLTAAGFSTEARGVFMSHIGLPWSFKPVFGLLSDFVPIAGYRRRSWLVLSGALTALGYGVLAIFPAARASYGGLLAAMFVANLAVAFTDVVVDATMVEAGQPLGMTGRLQSIQWGCMSGAIALAKLAGGYVAEPEWRHLGFVLCAVISCGTIVLTLWGVPEKRDAIPTQDAGSAIRSFGRAFRSPVILLGGAFLLLLNFNPFSGEVINAYETDVLQFDKPLIGRLDSASAWSQMAASFLYATYCTRVRFSVLVHASVLLGILSNLGYWWLQDSSSAVPIFLFTGFVYQTATMIQLDLAARVCPPQIAGTMFALLMALSNTGITLSSYFGGGWYDGLRANYGDRTAFHLLVAIGACFTAGCWVLVPWMLRLAAKHDAERASAESAA